MKDQIEFKLWKELSQGLKVFIKAGKKFRKAT